jgi:hypothetical protein
MKPWLALGISESTYRRRKRRDSGDSDSSAACAKHIESGTNYCHHNDSDGARAARQARGRVVKQSDILARAVPAVSATDGESLSLDRGFTTSL